MSSNPEPLMKILVTDFDGTITRRDFYQLVLNRVPPGTPDFWGEYLAGRITHFEALNAVFGAYTPGETALIALTHDMEIDPGLHQGVEMLRGAGWSVQVASAGCSWYIQRLLREADVAVDVFANPGMMVDGRLLMSLPRDSPFFSPMTGIDKRGIVQNALETGAVVAFAGDGPPDFEPALLVPENLRFATGFLAGELTRRGLGFRPFGRWSEVAETLCLADQSRPVGGDRP